MTRIAPACCLSAILLAAAAPAQAGGLNLGPVAQVPALSGLSGRIAVPASSGSFAPTGAGAGMNVRNADGVTVQTNIQSGNNVQAGSNVSVNETINGVSVGYGLGGDFLGDADAQAQAQWAQRQATYQQLQNDVSLMVQVWQASGN